jgi:dihydroorotase
MKLLIKNARVIDPANNIDDVLDIFIDNKKIKELKKNIQIKADKVIEATGKIVIPGIVDIHVHLREPGREDKETILTASRAAAIGGVTSLVSMPNTNPAIDNIKEVRALREKIKRDSRINIKIAAAITKGRLGKEVTDITSLKKEGVVSITDDGTSIEDNKIMEKALISAKKEKMLVMCHCEDVSLSKGGLVNGGFTSTKMGLRPQTREAEYRRVERDILLAEKTTTPIHIQHVSCKESVDIIDKAKKRGVRLSAETAPHYFTLSEEAVWGYDTDMKMNPPLRSKEDVQAIRQGLKNGVIDAIASDHAPHTVNEKAIEFERAAFGVIGLETELAISITELINTGLLTWSQLIRTMTVNPAKIINSDRGTLSIDSWADIAIISPEEQWVVKKDGFASKSSNSCFCNRKVTGIVEHTICCGDIIYSMTR